MRANHRHVTMKVLQMVLPAVYLCKRLLCSAIVSRAKWLRNPVKFDLAHLLYSHRLCMNYIIAMLLLVSCISTHNYLLYFSRFCAGSTPKIAIKNTLLLHPFQTLLTLSFLLFCRCSSHNSSHYIPFSADLPFQPITLEIK